MYTESGDWWPSRREPRLLYFSVSLLFVIYTQNCPNGGKMTVRGRLSYTPRFPAPKRSSAQNDLLKLSKNNILQLHFEILQACLKIISFQLSQSSTLKHLKYTYFYCITTVVVEVFQFIATLVMRDELRSQVSKMYTFVFSYDFKCNFWRTLYFSCL